MNSLQTSLSILCHDLRNFRIKNRIVDLLLFWSFLLALDSKLGRIEWYAAFTFIHATTWRAAKESIKLLLSISAFLFVCDLLLWVLLFRNAGPAWLPRVASFVVFMFALFRTRHVDAKSLALCAISVLMDAIFRESPKLDSTLSLVVPLHVCGYGVYFPLTELMIWIVEYRTRRLANTNVVAGELIHSPSHCTSAHTCVCATSSIFASSGECNATTSTSSSTPSTTTMTPPALSSSPSLSVMTTRSKVVGRVRKGFWRQNHHLTCAPSRKHAAQLHPPPQTALLSAPTTPSPTSPLPWTHSSDFGHREKKGESPVSDALSSPSPTLLPNLPSPQTQLRLPTPHPPQTGSVYPPLPELKDCFYTNQFEKHARFELCFLAVQPYAVAFSWIIPPSLEESLARVPLPKPTASASSPPSSSKNSSYNVAIMSLPRFEQSAQQTLFSGPPFSKGSTLHSPNETSPDFLYQCHHQSPDTADFRRSHAHHRHHYNHHTNHHSHSQHQSHRRDPGTNHRNPTGSGSSSPHGDHHTTAAAASLFIVDPTTVFVRCDGILWTNVVWRLAEGFCVVYGLNSATQYEMVMSVSGFESLEARVFTLSALTTAGQVFPNLVDVIGPQVDGMAMDSSVIGILDLVDPRYGKNSAHCVYNVNEDSHGNGVLPATKSEIATPSVVTDALLPADEDPNLELGKEELFNELSRIQELKREAQSELKMLRKANIKSEQQLRQELETLRSALSKSATSDHRAKQRVQSLEEQSRQQEVLIESLTEQVAAARDEHDVVGGRAEEAANVCNELRETLSNMEKVVAKNRQSHQKTMHDLNARAIRIATTIADQKSKMTNLVQTEIPKLKVEISRLQNSISLESAKFSIVRQLPPGYLSFAAAAAAYAAQNMVTTAFADSPLGNATNHDTATATTTIIRPVVSRAGSCTPSPTTVSSPAGVLSNNSATTPNGISSVNNNVAAAAGTSSSSSSTILTPLSILPNIRLLSSPSPSSPSSQHQQGIINSRSQSRCEDNCGANPHHHQHRQKRSFSSSCSSSSPLSASFSFPLDVASTSSHHGYHSSSTPSSGLSSPVVPPVSEEEGGGPGVFLRQIQMQEIEFARHREQIQREIRGVVERNRVLRETKEEEGRFRERLEEILRGLL